MNNIERTKEELEAYIRAFDKILDGTLKELDLFDEECGICFNMGEALELDGVYYDYLDHDCGYQDWGNVVSTYWPLFSGNKKYPVPDKDLSAIYMYMNTPNMWIGEYGQLRLSLLHFLKDTATEQLEGLQGE